MSYGAYTTDSKFGRAKDFIDRIEKVTGKEVINTMNEAEVIESDIMIIAPCSRK